MNLEQKNSPNKELPAKFDISIVVVSYNTASLTLDCIHSINENSAGLVVQVIVIDNNSTDRSTEKIAAEFPNVTIVENKTNRGFAAANNQGFALCESQYILLLNSDTLIIGNVLKDSIAFLESNRDVGAMGCQVLNPDQSIQATCSNYPSLFRLMIMALALDRVPYLDFLDTYLMRSWKRDAKREVEVISGCYILTRAEIIHSLGGLDERFFFFAEETDWCRRVREAGWKTVFAPVGKIVHYGGGSVKKLNYKRDVMLTSAMVQLHEKHGGKAAKIIAYITLMFFNLSRCTIWFIAAVSNKANSRRARHFFNVMKDCRACWPKKDRP